jgi:hypothetical protein
VTAHPRRRRWHRARPSNSRWYSSAFSPNPTGAFGAATDQVAVGDYDGDGDIEEGYFRPSTGTWHSISTAGTVATLGQSGDLPAPGHWDNN